MKNHLSCVIVDDEPLAQELIEKFIDRVPYLSRLATYDNAIMATREISALQPDILFLDVNMPEMTGLDFLKSLVGNRPHVILITAHQQHAYEGFEQDVVDFLLKPVPFSRFMKAIHKLEKRLSLGADTTTAVSSDKSASDIPSPTIPFDDFFLVKQDKKLIKIAFADIMYVEGMKDYVKIHLADRYIITHMTMKKVMEHLPDQFLRINRSFIIQVALIKHLEGNMITMVDDERLTVGVNYRDTVRNLAKKWTL